MRNKLKFLNEGKHHQSFFQADAIVFSGYSKL